MKIFLSISWLLIIVSIPPVNKNLGEYCLLGHQRPPPHHNHFLPYNTQQIQIQISEPTLYHTTNTNTRIKDTRHQYCAWCSNVLHNPEQKWIILSFTAQQCPNFDAEMKWLSEICLSFIRTLESLHFFTHQTQWKYSTNRFMYNLGIRAHQLHKLFKNNHRVHYKVSVTVRSIVICSCKQATSISDDVF